MISFEHLEAGDKVILDHHYITDEVCTVARLTKTQIVLNGKPHVKFRRDNGEQVGSNSWTTAKLAPWSKDREKEILTFTRCKSIARDIERKLPQLIKILRSEQALESLSQLQRLIHTLSARHKDED